jgi:AraC family transcriptional activator of pobA
MSNKKAPSLAISQYHFLPRKHGRDLLLDIGRIETLENFVLDSTPHQLSFYEIIFLEKGSGHLMLDEHIVPLTPGTIIFTSPGQVRRWYAKRPVTGYALFFEKDFLNLFFTDELFLYRFQYFHQYANPASMKVTAVDFRQAEQLVKGIEQEFVALRNDSSHLIRSILYQLLVTLNRWYARIYELQGDTYVHPDFFRFRSLLEQKFRTHHQVADYVSMLRMSPTQLNRICRQYGGLSAQKMIHHKRLSEIKKALRGRDTVSEIAYAFGFSDPSNFNRFFKKLAGTTPRQFRDAL